MNENKRNMENAISRVFIERKLDVGIMFVATLLGAYFEWNIVEIVIFLVFIWSIIGPIPSKFLAGPALFFLTFTPFLLAFGRKDQAEEFAVYAYYFLVMAVIRGIVEAREDDNQEKGSQKL